jgi:hypothetical protein
MNKLSPIVLGLSLAVAGSAMAAAQESSSQPASMPKVLQITREYVKPYRGGAAHDRTENAFVRAMMRAKFPTHYIALDSLSGKARALYLTWYDSFEAWGRDNETVETNKALAAELERASIADGELLDSVDSEVLTYDENMSYNPNGDLSHARYIEASVYHIRIGYGEEWREAVKRIIEAHKQGGSSAHWATFHQAFGGEGGTYVMFTAYKSMAELDHSESNYMRAHDSMGEEDFKKTQKLFGEAVDSTHRELFAINPRQSYAPEEWINADPEFWKPRPAAAPAAMSAAAPAAKPATEEKKVHP